MALHLIGMAEGEYPNGSQELKGSWARGSGSFESLDRFEVKKSIGFSFVK